MSGYHQCDGTETTATCGDGDLPERHCTFPSTGAEDITLDRLFQCSEHGSAAHGSDANLDCHSSLTACNDGNNHIANDCPHTLDQGAICFHEGESPTERRQCRACGTSTDRWHGCDADGCQTCQGNAFSQQGTVAGQHSQDIVFGCIQFASTQCTYNANENGGDFAHALRGFATCAGVNPQPAGYCHTSLISAEQLRNQDICVDGANSDIGFHIRIPFTVNSPGSYQFRMHADYGNGAFIGIDGAQHTPGNTWGHLLLTDSDCTDGRQNDRITLETGDHEFEALGFEDCCDGHAELEVHLPCDDATDPWRIVTAGHNECMTCGSSLAETCTAQTESAACCGASGTHVLCSVPAEGTTCEDATPADPERNVDPASIFGRFVTIGETMTLTDATAFCTEHYAGLASIHSPAEAAHAAQSCSFYSAAENAPVGCWIGLTDEASEGGFVWMDGSAVDFVDWNAGEPNNSGDNGEDAVNMVSSKQAFFERLSEAC